MAQSLTVRFWAVGNDPHAFTPMSTLQVFCFSGILGMGLFFSLVGILMPTHIDWAPQEALESSVRTAEEQAVGLNSASQASVHVYA
jgi:hypothetical protein